MNGPFAGHDLNRCHNFVRVNWPAELGLPNRARCDLVDNHTGFCRCRMGPPGREVLIVFCDHDVGHDWTRPVRELADVA